MVSPEQLKKITRPTVIQYGELESAFDFFNENLFVRLNNTKLPQVMLTIVKSSRHAGYFQHRSWCDKANKEIASEISTNPFTYSESGIAPLAFAKTLVHEMLHLGQYEFPEVFGKPSPRGYHNKSFGNSMNNFGLMTSNTGMPGGKKTGNAMSEYVIEGGEFEKVYKQFIKLGFGLSWKAAFVRQNPSQTTELVDPNNPASVAAALLAKEREQKRRSKTKYTCPSCSMNAWAKPGVAIGCLKCSAKLQEVTK